MLGVTLGPLVDGTFDFSFVPFAWHKIIGFALNFSGFTVILAALRAMHGSFTVTVRPRSSGELITRGIFRRTRNPIYLGGLLMCLGWSISFASSLSCGLSALLTLVLLLKIRYEEIELLRKFGSGYQRYRELTPKLLPF